MEIDPSSYEVMVPWKFHGNMLKVVLILYSNRVR